MKPFKITQTFMQHEVLLTLSQEFSACPNPVPEEFNQYTLSHLSTANLISVFISLYYLPK
jgi:hypothetical protein